MSEELDRDDSAFAARAPTILAMLQKPKRMVALKLEGARHQPKLGAKEVEEIVFWLELQGRARSFRAFDGIKRFVAVGVAIEDDSPPEAKPHHVGGASAPQETAPMPKNSLLSNAEVCEMLGCTSGLPCYLAKTGRIEKKDGKYTRASVEKHAATRKAAPKPGRKGGTERPSPVVERKKAPRKSVKPPPKRVIARPKETIARRDIKPQKAAAAPLNEQVRALAAVVDLGVLTVEAAWTAVVGLVR